MTLYDFGSLLRHYWKIVIFIPIICALGVGAFFYLDHERQYSATSSITPYELTGKVYSSNVASVVTLLANEYISENGYTGVVSKQVSGTTSTDLSSVEITVVRSSPEECMNLANEICSAVAKRAEEYYENIEEEYSDDLLEDNSNSVLTPSVDVSDYVIVDSARPSNANFRYYAFYTSDATSAEAVSANTGKWTLVAFFGALFITVCLIVLFDLLRRPINQARVMQENLELPLLNGFTKAKTGEDVWANLRFVAGPDIKSVCLIPLGSTSAELVGDKLVHAIEASGLAVHAGKYDSAPGKAEKDYSEESGLIEILECPSISQGMVGAYAAREASATVICARAWKDTSDDLQRTLRELELAEARPAGLILLG